MGSEMCIRDSPQQIQASLEASGGTCLPDNKWKDVCEATSVAAHVISRSVAVGKLMYA